MQSASAVIFFVLGVAIFEVCAIRVAHPHPQVSFNKLSETGLCNPTTPDTRAYGELRAMHKMGTVLHTEGARCIAKYYNRAGKPAAVSARGHCKFDDTDGEFDQKFLKDNDDPLLTRKTVHWTRNPFSWVISNYLFHKRGGDPAEGDPEPMECWLKTLRDPAQFARIKDKWPSIPPVLEKETSYTEYLQRVSEEEGLTSELFRNSGNYGERCESTLAGLTREAMKDEDNTYVCLESFMHGPDSFVKKWHTILEYIGGGDGDADLDTCLMQFEPTSNHISHSTHWDVTAEDHERMRNLIARIDAHVFDGMYAKATKKIGCGEVSHEQFAKIFKIE